MVDRHRIRKNANWRNKLPSNLTTSHPLYPLPPPHSPPTEPTHGQTWHEILISVIRHIIKYPPPGWLPLFGAISGWISQSVRPVACLSYKLYLVAEWGWQTGKSRKPLSAYRVNARGSFRGCLGQRRSKLNMAINQGHFPSSTTKTSSMAYFIYNFFSPSPSSPVLK